MVVLKSCEIMDELKKLGISSSSELIQYVIEYAVYYSIRSIQLDAIKD